MTPESRHVIFELDSLANGTEKELFVTPLISDRVSTIIGYINAYFLGILIGVVGVFTNTANISVYWRMGLSETTNIDFFALSIVDLLVSFFDVVIQITRNRPVSVMTMPSGAPVSELGMGAIFFIYACLGSSSWITAILSIERCLCISMPLKVKEIVTPKRTVILILTMVVYQTVFIVLLFFYPGPPYDVFNQRRALYYNCTFSFPSFICFFVVLFSTTLLVVRLKQNLEWRSEAAKQSNQTSGGSKERKAARCVVAICVIFIICFAPNAALIVLSLVFPNFNTHDPYVGSLKRILYGFSSLLQVLSSAINIGVYYRMGTKYREVFDSMFCRKSDKTPTHGLKK